MCKINREALERAVLFAKSDYPKESVLFFWVVKYYMPLGIEELEPLPFSNALAIAIHDLTAVEDVCVDLAAPSILLASSSENLARNLLDCIRSRQRLCANAHKFANAVQLWT